MHRIDEHWQQFQVAWRRWRWRIWWIWLHIETIFFNLKGTRIRVRIGTFFGQKCRKCYWIFARATWRLVCISLWGTDKVVKVWTEPFVTKLLQDGAKPATISTRLPVSEHVFGRGQNIESGDLLSNERQLHTEIRARCSRLYRPDENTQAVDEPTPAMD